MTFNPTKGNAVSSCKRPDTPILLINIFFCSVLFPFVSPLPIQTDTQPVAFVLALLLLMYFAIQERRFSYKEIFILLVPAMGFLYINPLISESGIPIGKYLSIFTGSVV